MSVRKPGRGRAAGAANITTNGFRIKCFACALGLLALAASPAGAFDFSGWDGLLKKHVRPTTLAGVRLNGVDYPALRGDAAYRQLVRELEGFDPATLGTKEQMLAFWINTYNVMAVKMVLDHYPLDSIKDAGGLFTSVWKLPVGKIGGREFTLNEIEHEILRKMGEPRIHAAIVCASVSCPDLRPEAFLPEQLDAQLNDQMRAFLANPGKGLRLDRGGEKLYLSSIFDWFEEDFESRGGVRAFVAKYAPEADRKEVASSRFSITHLDYNWDLNGL